MRRRPTVAGVRLLVTRWRVAAEQERAKGRVHSETQRTEPAHLAAAHTYGIVIADILRELLGETEASTIAPVVRLTPTDKP